MSSGIIIDSEGASSRSSTVWGGGVRALRAGICLALMSAPLARAELPVPLAGGQNQRWQGAELPRLDGRQLTWQDAGLPRIEGSQMTVKQTADSAVLHWQSFNIDPGSSVRFEQPSSSAVALNRIFQGDPSRIMGKLSANGQLFLINQNGFLFGRDSSVDVQTLVASTLNIDDRIFEDVGLLGAIDEPGNLPAFQADGDMGEIRIDAGARLQTVDGGRIMILAPKITNSGSIETPGGQAILAASQDKVYLASSDDPDVRGLLVEVETGGDVNNLGSVIAERGNVSLLGLAVNQDGLVRATTSATLNGSIRLLAQDTPEFVQGSDGVKPKKPLAGGRAGVLTLGADSRTEVLVDRADTSEQAPDSQLQPRSSIKLVGRQVTVRGGATLRAPSADVQVSALSRPSAMQTSNRAAQPGVSLRIEKGARIDVSGTDDTVLPVSSNIITVEALGNELADSPRQRDGALRGKKLRVDVRKGSPLLDISSVVANIQRGASERLATGGTLTLSSDGDLVAEAGSRLDISGGRVTYTGALMSTTRLITDDYKIVDISKANPNRVYRGVLGDQEVVHAKWGVVERFGSSVLSVYEPGYTEGRDAGTLSINSPRLAWAAEIVAGSHAGRWQRQPTEGNSTKAVRAFNQRPFGGSVDLVLATNQNDVLPSVVVSANDRLRPLPQTGEAIDPRLATSLSAAMLNRSGLARISIRSPGEIRIEPGGGLDLAPGAQLSLKAGRIVFDDGVRTPGGAISASAQTAASVIPPEDVGIEVAAGVTLDVAGLWSNDSPLLNAGAALAPVVVDGGSIELNSGGDLDLQAGSRLAADAGAWRSADGAVKGGNGGDVALSAVSALAPADLRVEGTMSARGFSDNGTLTVDAEGFTLDGEHIAPDVSVALDGFSSYRFTAHRNGIYVSPGARLRLQQTNLQLAAGNESVRSGAPLPATRVRLPDWKRAPVDLELVSLSDADNYQRAPLLHVGEDASVLADPGATLSLRSDTSLQVDGSLVAKGGRIALALETDEQGYRPEQKIWLGDRARLDVSGVYVAEPNDDGRRTGRVWDGGRVELIARRGSIVTRPGSLIDVHGVAATLDLPRPGGAPGQIRYAPVNVAGRAGEVVMSAAETALLQGDFDAASAASSAEGGRFNFSFDPNLRDAPPLEQEASNPPATRFPRTRRTLMLADYEGESPGADDALSPALNGQAFVPAQRLLARGFSSLDLSSRPAQDGNFLATPDSLASIRFDRDLTLRAGRAIVLDAPLFENSGVNVSLVAPYVALGTRLDVRVDGALPKSEATGGGRRIALAPAPGEGRLDVEAAFVDVIGHSVWQGFGSPGHSALQIASRGDIRLRGLQASDGGQPEKTISGSLRTAGDIHLTAAQVYPSTLSQFQLSVEGGENGRVRIDGAAGQVAHTPLSAGGSITLSAAVIEQAGTLRAPLGSLQLDAAKRLALLPGSLTSVAATGQPVPFGQLRFQTDLVFPLSSSVTSVPTAPPERAIRLAAPAVDLAPGAQLDLSGGGETRAWEFVPGPGGSKDLLLADLDPGKGSDQVLPNPSFALLPLSENPFAPWDPLESPLAESVQGLRVGDTLHLEGGAGIAAGEYALAPARYALYGGYLVTPVAGSQDLVAGARRQREDGAPILSGRRGVAGSAFVESRSQGYAIENGERVRLRAQYVEKNLDALFPDAVTRSADAGRLSVEAGQALRLGATVLPNRASGRGSQVDISADNLRVVVRPSGEGIELTADELAQLGAESLLLGGTRRDVGDVFQVDAKAQRLEIAAGVELALPELLLVAHQIDIGGGDGKSVLRAEGAALAAGNDLDVRGDAAVVAVSRRKGLQARRSELPAIPSARVTVSDDSQLLADAGGLIADSPDQMDLRGRVSAQGGSMQLGAARVSLGETDALGLDGLVLNNADLAGLQGTDLILRSGAQVDLYGVLLDSAGESLRLGNLSLDATGLIGHNLLGGRIALRAGQVELANFSGRAAAVAAAPMDGSLSLDADRLVIDGADGGPGFALAGFDSATLRTAGVRFQGGGRLQADGDLRVETPRITAASGTDGGLSSGGRLELAGPAVAVEEDTAGKAGLAARLSYQADAIVLDTEIDLPSGRLAFDAAGAGGLTLTSGAVANVAGRIEVFGAQRIGTPGGSIELTAQQGDVRLDGLLALSDAATGAAGGRLRVQTPNGALRLEPGLRLQADDAAEDVADGSGYRLDVRTLEAAQGDGLAAWLALVGPADFRAEQALRQRAGDLQLASGSRIRAQRVLLSADTGDVVVDGEIDASGRQGGRIELAAGDKVLLAGTLDASANGDDVSAGSIVLTSLDADGDGRLGIRGDAGAQIKLAGGGTLQLYLPFSETGAVMGLETFDATVTGAAQREVLALRQLRNPELDLVSGWSTLRATALTDEFARLQGFMAAAPDVLPAGLRLRPGLEVRADAGLRLADDIDLRPTRFGAHALPGVLILRAGGDLMLAGSLSDAVSSDATTGARLDAGESWSYHLSSGADFTGAGLDAMGQTATRLSVDDGRFVRTGSGDITLSSSGDILLGKDAAVFTFGRDAGSGAFGDVVFPQFGDLDGNAILYLLTGGIQFGRDGGDVTLHAAGDLRGAGVAGLNQDWQPKVGGDYRQILPGSELPVIRGINLERFSDGVGALGGGALEVEAMGDVRGLTLAVPSSQLPVENLGVVNDSGATVIVQRPDTRFAQFGGRSLRVRSGGDLLDTYVQIDRGRGRVSAARDIGPGDDGASLFGLGDADLRLLAGRDIRLDSIFDPGLIPQSPYQFDVYAAQLGSRPQRFDTLYFTQSGNAAFQATALAGDVSLNAESGPLLNLVETGVLPNNETDPALGLSRVDAQSINALSLNFVPAKLSLRALQGDIAFTGGKPLWSLPAVDGRIEILADQNITGVPAGALNQSDADPGLLPRTAAPMQLLIGSDALSGNLLARIASSSDILFHARTPVHQGDGGVNTIVARQGSWFTDNSGSASTSSFSLQTAKQTRVLAGTDVRDVQLFIQHANGDDLSVVQAGRDIRQNVVLNPSTGSVTADERVIQISGPGHIHFQAGRAIDFGASKGVESIGNTANTFLPPEGASVSLMAGYEGEPEYAAFQKAYVDERSDYLPQLQDFLGTLGLEAPDAATARAALAELDVAQRNRFLYKVFFAELKAAGVAATDPETGTGDYSRGFAAIDRLFPNPNPQGRIDLKLSKIFTLDGGDIDLLVPGGLIDGGATNLSGLSKGADELGIVTGRSGNINAFVDGDFLVNQSRVFALNGDLLMWSSNGNIDAGRGAKTALASPSPQTRIDPVTGQTVVEFPPNISGSGLLGVNGFLFAPRGVIDAGDAGIKATANLTLGAREVIGAGNIDVGGIAIGVPVANVGGLAAGLAGVSNIASSASKLAEQSAAGLAGGDQDAQADKPLGLLSVEVVGFGEPGDRKKDKRRE